jgi:dipeptidyl-peptidase 4
MNLKHHFTCLIVILACSAIATHSQTPSAFSDTGLYNSLRDALLSGNLQTSNGPQGVNWIDNGNRYSFIATNSESSLTEIRVYDPVTNTDELVFNGSDLTFPGSDEPFEYRSFQWADDSRHLLFETRFRPVYRHSGIADYYFYSLDDNSLELVAKDAGTAELSPDGSMIGFERDGDMYVYDFTDGEETRLTTDAREHVFNGRFGWVYEEEFGLAQAWSWSNDSRYIAYWQEDESQVPVFQMTDFSGVHSDFVKIRYPKAGDKNPYVRIGVVDVHSGKQQWLKTDETDDSYIPRIYWTSDSHVLAVVHLNRNQNHLKLFFFDVRTGERNLVFEETSDTWIDVFNFFEGINHFFFFPDNVREFFWISDRDAYRHLYRYSYEGELRNQVTHGEWDVAYIHDVDDEEQLIYYSSTETSPLERHLFSVRFDGTGKKRISSEPGRHSFDVSPNTRYYIDRWSDTQTPTMVVLRSIDGNKIKFLEDNSSITRFKENHFYSPRELFHFTTSEGIGIDGYMVKPLNFDENSKYPVMLDVYGGPGAQSVYNQFETNSWVQYLAQEGWIVVSINNRGSSGYGRDFEKNIYKNLGILEARDFMETGRYLTSLPYVDNDRLAIRGHSYGGYMAALTMVLHPGIFNTGIATAPVTDWRLYDTIYTERYMGQPDDNPEGYDSSSVIKHAGQLDGRLLLVHSAMDENVHLKHTLQLVKALADEGKDADLRIYPPGAHGVAYNTSSYLLLYEVYTNYLNSYTR